MVDITVIRHPKTGPIMRITPEYVRSVVQRIYDMREDDAYAHSLEDELREDLIVAIAVGNCEQPQLCAYEASRTNDICFGRCCA